MENTPGVTLKVASLIGQTIYTRAIAGGEAMLTISTREWDNGIYALQLFDKAGKVVHAELLVISK